jgi:ABC-type multidrug transport system fused ATPase/permease subunit
MMTGILGGRKFAAVQNQRTTTTTNSASSSSSVQQQAMSSSLASLYAMPEGTNDGEDSDSEDEDHHRKEDESTLSRTPWETRPTIRAGASEADPAALPLSHQASRPLAQFQLQQPQPQPQPTGADATIKRPFAARTEQQQTGMPQQSQQPVRTTSSYDSVGESKSWFSRVPLPSLPPMPSVISKLLGRGSGSYRAMAAATMDVWKDEEQTSRRWSSARRQQVKSVVSSSKGIEPSSSMPPLTDLLSRCNYGKSTSLLSNHDAGQCRAIGRNKAILDLVCLGLVIRGVREILSVSGNVVLQHSLDDGVAAAASAFVDASRGWAFYALSAAVLASATNFVVFDSRIRALTDSIGATVRGASRYSQLYMRLVAGQPVERQVPNRMQQAAEAQVMERIQTARLQSFVSLVLATMLLLTVSVVQPILFAILGSLVQLVTLPELRSWPIPWAVVVSFLNEILGSLGGTINELLVGQFSTFMASPIAFAFQLSFCAALAAVAYLPSLAHRAKVRSLDDYEKDEDVSASAFGTVTTLSNLGVSSASRLGLLSKSGALEGTLERWRATLPPQSNLRDVHSSRSWLQQIGYTAVSTLVLMAPIFIYASCFAGVCTAASTVSGAIRFNSIWDVSILLLFALGSSWKSIARTIESSNLRPYVQSFVNCLSEVVEEVSGSQKGTEPQLGTAMSPNVGLSVRDLWAAHTSKRAWAVRGASFDCHNGEVVAILGDDGAGKSRLLTAIAETLVNPSKRSLTTTKVRGAVSIGGLDCMKWDREQLKKRLGLFLNDVRTIADNAEFMSGFTLEEILEPMDGLSNQNPTAGARAANQALQITGLSSTLIPQLPSKLSTVVTANENDLMPSPLRPRCHALSPSEWSKLLLARVLAQTIFDNENVSSAPLVGSLLLLDDLMTYLSEVEELRLLAALRKTGAATVFTSHKWASGRLADRIVVVNDGAVVESGSHNELLARGPQQSVYAAKWHAMTTG